MKKKKKILDKCRWDNHDWCCEQSYQLSNVYLHIFSKFWKWMI